MSSSSALDSFLAQQDSAGKPATSAYPGSALDSFLSSGDAPKTPPAPGAKPDQAEANKAILDRMQKEQDQTWAQRMGINTDPKTQGKTQAALQGVVDFAQGVGSGGASTVYHTADLARRMTGHPSMMNEPDVKAATTPPPTTAGAVGHGAEQAGEFLAPGGVVGKAGKVIDAVTAGKKLAPVARLFGKAIVDAASGAAVSGAQTGGDPTAMRNAALASGATSAVLGGATAAVNAAKPFIRNQLNPVEQQALDWAETNGIPISTGQASGSGQVQRLESGLQNMPGSAGKTQEFFKGQEHAIRDAGQDLVNRTQPGTTMGPFETGESLGQAVQRRIASDKQIADAKYSQVRSTVEANPTTVQTGTKASSIVGPNGAPIQSPVFETINAPVDLTGAKANLSPVYDELTKAMPEYQRQASPGLQALKQIIEGPDMQDALTVDRNLGAVKALFRKQANPYLTTRSQGFAGKAIGELSDALDGTLSGLPGDALKTLNEGRAAVKSQHEVAELMATLPREPVQLYDRIASAGDRSASLMQQLNAYAPGEMRQVGRTFLEGLMQKATTEGGFARAPGLMATWQKMGPRTKQLLFGSPQAVQELNNFFLAAKRLTGDVNPSGTGKLLAALGPAGALLDGLFSPGDIKDKAPRLALEAGGGMAGARALSNLLLSPAGRQFLTQTAKSALPQTVSTALPAAAAATAAAVTPPRRTVPNGVMPPP